MLPIALATGFSGADVGAGVVEHAAVTNAIAITAVTFVIVIRRPRC